MVHRKRAFFSIISVYIHHTDRPNSQCFFNHLQFQQKAVARGRKLSFAEFDGKDPDCWIRKAEKIL
jgi:hypothetical protein